MFTEEDIQRYSRHILLPEVGGKGQLKLKEAKVLMIGAGGLGSPVALYLAAAGVGTLGIVDMDVVDLSNLQRQVLHTTADVGRPKVESAKETLTAINPGIMVNAYRDRLGPDNVMELIKQYDIIVDGVDNFPTRFLLNDACVMAQKPLVEAGILRWDGMVMTIKPGEGPCYRCVFPEPPPPGSVPTCQEAGVIGAIAGVMGVLQATEVIKLILGVGQNLTGRLLTFDALQGKFREVKIKRNHKCAVCGDDPIITELTEYELKCELRGNQKN
ncbi:MAG: molybdopterin-synthase adenylyltransferase MoeB [Bacillota bacterium]|nr:molybdopterin-synthase adenylyltransferase MoeB [Bacillota bacterium]